MKIIPVKLAGILALSLLLLTRVSATPIELVPPSPDTTANASPATEWAALSAGITLYNSVTPASLPGAGAIDLTPQIVSGGVDSLDGHVDTSSGPTSITFDFSLEHETYVILQWDGLDGHDYWYVGNETGIVTFTNTDVLNTGNGSPQGLSHYMFTGPSVPDGGTTAVLVGLGLVGLSFIARRRKIA